MSSIDIVPIYALPVREEIAVFLNIILIFVNFWGKEIYLL